MKKLVLGLVFVLVMAACAAAVVPTKMSIQGRLTNETTGDLITSANLRVVVTHAATTIYNQMHTSAVSDGLFYLQLGESSDLNLSYNADYNLSVYVGSSSTPVGGPYSFRGGQGEINVEDVADVYLLNTGDTATGDYDITGNLTVTNLTINNKLSCSKLYTNANGDVQCGTDLTNVTVGTGLIGGGADANVTLSINTSSVPRMDADETITGNWIFAQGINLTGNVSGSLLVEDNLTADDISILNKQSCSKLYTDSNGNVMCGIDLTNVTAGDGLIGGGEEGNATLDVGQGTGIIVAADYVSINTSIVPRKDTTDTISGIWTFSDDLIVSGDLYIMGNLTNMNVNTVYVNGSFEPSLNNLFDLGSSTMAWKDAYLSSDVIVNGYSVLTSNTDAGGNLSGNFSNLQLTSDSVASAQIVSGAVTEAKIASNAVTVSKIADKNITTAKIDGEAVTADKLAPDAVTQSKIDSDAVTEDAIASGAVKAPELDSNAVTATGEELDSSVAGAGLTLGTGPTLGQLEVVAGDGLVVSSDTVKLNASAAGDGLSLTSGALNINAGDGLAISGDDVVINSTAAGDGLAFASGVISITAGDGIDVYGDAVLVNATDLFDLAGGTNVSTSNDLVLRTCAENEVLKSASGDWACSQDSSGNWSETATMIWTKKEVEINNTLTVGKLQLNDTADDSNNWEIFEDDDNNLMFDYSGRKLTVSSSGDVNITGGSLNITTASKVVDADGLCIDSNCRTSWLWTLSGSDAYYTSGKVIISGAIETGGNVRINGTSGNVSIAGNLSVGSGIKLDGTNANVNITGNLSVGSGVFIDSTTNRNTSTIILGDFNDGTHNHYIQLDITSSAPPSEDCDSNTEYGRMIYSNGGDTLYVCDGTGGWKSVTLT